MQHYRIVLLGLTFSSIFINPLYCMGDGEAPPRKYFDERTTDNGVIEDPFVINNGNGQDWSTYFDKKGKGKESCHKKKKKEKEGFFKPIFDGEDLSNYTKLDSYMIKSLLENCPKELRFRVGLLHNFRTYESLKKTGQFSINKILLYGPPGSGKSSLARAIADYCNFPRQFIIASSLVNQYKNSGQANLRKLFGPLFKTKKQSVFIMDELTGLTNRHNKKNNSDEGTLEILFGILDHCELHKNLLFIATTNEIKELPDQIKDRFCGSMYKIDVPNLKRREKYISKFFCDRVLITSDESMNEENENIQYDFVKIDYEITPKVLTFITQKTKDFTMRQLNEMKHLSIVYALERFVDENYNIKAPIIALNLDDYKKALAELYAIKAAARPSGWKKYKKMFLDFYPIMIPLIQLSAGLYLQYKGMIMQQSFAQICHDDQMKLQEKFQIMQFSSQQEFQQWAHENQMVLQQKHNETQLMIQDKDHIEQRLIQEKYHKEQVSMQERHYEEQQSKQKSQGLDKWLHVGIGLFEGLGSGALLYMGQVVAAAGLFQNGLSHLEKAGL